MQAFLNEIRATLNAGIYSTALVSVLVVPDACGAVESPHLGNSQRYKFWYNNYVEPFAFTALGGEIVWKIRNSMLHEAAMQFDSLGFDRVLFTLPSKTIVLDQNIMKGGAGHSDVLNLDLESFVARIIVGAEKWLSIISDDSKLQSRLERLLQIRPEGLSPWIVGVPLIA